MYQTAVRKVTEKSSALVDGAPSYTFFVLFVCELLLSLVIAILLLTSRKCCDSTGMNLPNAALPACPAIVV